MTTEPDRIQNIRLADIVRDPALQPRRELNAEVADGYLARMRAGDRFPPIQIVRINGVLKLADGSHRLMARTFLREPTIEAVVTDGTMEDAVRIATEENVKHGLSFTVEEKRRAIEMYLQQPKLKKLSLRQIAERLRCSPTTVGTVRKRLDGERRTAREASEVSRLREHYQAAGSPPGQREVSVQLGHPPSEPASRPAPAAAQVSVQLGHPPSRPATPTTPASVRAGQPSPMSTRRTAPSHRAEPPPPVEDDEEEVEYWNGEPTTTDSELVRLAQGTFNDICDYIRTKPLLAGITPEQVVGRLLHSLDDPLDDVPHLTPPRREGESEEAYAERLSREGAARTLDIVDKTEQVLMAGVRCQLEPLRPEPHTPDGRDEAFVTLAAKVLANALSRPIPDLDLKRIVNAVLEQEGWRLEQLPDGERGDA